MLEKHFGRWRARCHGKKGQSALEFALVFPFFLLAVYAIIYFGFVFADYTTMNNIARSAARDASLSVPDSDGTYDSVRTREIDKLVSTGGMPSENLTDGQPLFKFVDATKTKGSDGKETTTYSVSKDRFKIETEGKDDENIVVTLYAPVNENAAIGKLFYMFSNLRLGTGNMSEAEKKKNAKDYRFDLKVTYTMYNENRGTSST